MHKQRGANCNRSFLTPKVRGSMINAEFKMAKLPIFEPANNSELNWCKGKITAPRAFDHGIMSQK